MSKNRIYSASDLAETLLELREAQYVRFAAHWLDHGIIESPEPELTGNAVVDALVAATVAYAAQLQGLEPPRWTEKDERRLEALWYPGVVGLFSWSLAHTPAAFFLRGIVVERDSLVSI